MCRVNPKKIKIVRKIPEYWLLPGNGSSDFIRPYRILLKEIEQYFINKLSNLIK